MVRPLVYYAVTIFMGCITCLILINNPIVGAFIAVIFIASMYFTIDKKFFYLVVCFFIIGIINYYSYFNINLPSDSKLKVRISDKSTYYCSARYNNKKINLKGNIFELSEGRNVWIKGSFKKEAVYEKGIVGTYTVKSYEICDEDIISKIETYRKGLHERFSESLGKEKAALVMGVCFGDSGYIEKVQKEDFKKLGISHVISVSGLHMSIVYKVLETVIGYKIALLFSFGYMIFTGGQSSTIRAFIMIFILKIASKVYKKYDSLSSVSLAAIIILVFRPFYILDIGFMLSFLCVLGIIVFNKKIRKALYKLPSTLNESFSLSISSQIFSTPYAVVALKTFCLGSILSNLVLLPFYTVVVILGNMGLVCSAFYRLFSLINYGLFTVLMIIEFIQKVLVALLPEMLYFSYIESLVVFGLYLCYLGIKKGYMQFKYVPICIIFVLVFQSYKIFPEVSYISVNKNNVVLIQYKRTAIAVTTGNIKGNDLKVPVKIDRVFENYTGKSTISLSKKYTIKLIRNRDKLEALVCFTQETNKKQNVELLKSGRDEITPFKDIVKLENDETYVPSGTIINKYIIIGNKVLKFSQGLEEIID
ncbi:ComEC/Rec2 family competence protein [Clostridium estertheticum]|uniref:ComEC/Rec2 family competence protein n=1 Tax=Clostridium estertheticum TaxID=238834 RepID=UPI001C6EDF41|nr:ComEC/Rec2 family competence protein [Clostridium estertheticum]MBW9152135.1 ComEC/Rec2 family competence protein [Clostridium estertheticum]WLC85161.1 ComEC/Rec2 family competence protein [Clostridium estertheticum]